MAEQKNNQDLDIRVKQLEKYFNYDRKSKGPNKGSSLAKFMSGQSASDFKQMLEYLKDTVKNEEKRLDIYKALNKYLERYGDLDRAHRKELNASVKSEREALGLLQKQGQQEKANNKSKKESNKLSKLKNAALSDANKILQKTIKNNQEIFKIGREMQLQSNATWKEYTKLYEEAFEGSRKVNAEIKQSIFNVKDLVNTQNRLMGSGWKDIDPKILTNVSSAVMQMGKTLGNLDARLIKGLEGSYRLFGNQTDSFVNQLGNQLNQFSKTFGVETQQLQKVVVDLMRSNNFINRSNIEANMRANESLIKAASLAHRVGLVSNDFIGQLATTSQYGTMEQMATVYQGGALLQGFNTQKFQQDMIGQNYETATRDLLTSVSDTLNSIDDHYLRAEYMQQIGGSFGFSQDDLLAIMTHGNKIGEYDQELQEKLTGVNSSMKDELTGLRVNLVDRAENWVQNSFGSQGMGKIMQDWGLYGLTDPVKGILRWVRIIALKGPAKALGGKALKALGATGVATGTSVAKTAPSGLLATGVPKIGAGGASTVIPQNSTTPIISGGGLTALTIAGGGLLAAGTNIAGRNIQMDTSRSDTNANLVGGAHNILGGAAGGALMGSAIPVIGTVAGALIGAGIGGINTLVGKNKREDKLDELDKADRQRRKANAASTFVDYGLGENTAVVNAINQQTDALLNLISGNHQENKTFVLLESSYKKNTTLSEV